MSDETLDKLRTRLNSLKEKCRSLVSEDRAMSDEEKKDFDATCVEIEDLRGRIRTLRDMNDDDEEKDDEEDKKDDEEKKDDEDRRKPVRSRGRVARPLGGHKPGKPDYSSYAEAQGYSLCRAIRSYIQGGKVSGLEAEVSQEIAKRKGKDPTGFYFPMSMSAHPKLDMEKRDLTTVTGSGSIPIYWQDFIEYLYNVMLTPKLGVRTLSNLDGVTRIPRQSGSVTAAFVSEGNAPASSNQTIDFAVLTPRTLAATVNVTRKFIMQATVDAESFVREDLAVNLAVSLDSAVLGGTYGDGTAQNPTGVLQNPLVTNTVSFGNAAPTWAKMVNLEALVEKGNALQQNLSYVTSPLVKQSLKTTPKVTGGASTFPIYLMGDDGMTNGYPVYSSNQIPETLNASGHGSGGTNGAIIFGNWYDCIIASFGDGIDLLPDPYSLSTSGTVRITALHDCDTTLRHGASFAIGVGAPLS